MRVAIVFVCCAFLCGLLMGGASSVLRAQQGSSSGGDVFAGQDPLSVQKVVAPATSLGTCTPPANANWKLLAQQNGNCYYVAPLPQPINGYVTSIKNVGAVEKLGGRCGLDEFNAADAVCQNAGDNFAGAAPTKGLPAGIGSNGQPNPNNSTASTGNYRRLPAPPALDPCHPNYDMSSAAGRAAAQQNAQQDQAACTEERCKHNPDLLICQNIVPSGPTETDPTPVPIVRKPVDPGPQPTRGGPLVPGPAPTYVPSPPVSVPAAVTPSPKTPPPVKPGPAQWTGPYTCDGTNCVFVDQNGTRWVGPQFMETSGGVYKIDPKQFRIRRNGNLVSGEGTYTFVHALPDFLGTPPKTATRQFDMQK